MSEFREAHNPVAMVVSNHPSQPSWSANTLDNSIRIEFVGIHVRRFQIDLNDVFSVCALPTIFDYKMVLSSLVDEGIGIYSFLFLLKVLLFLVGRMLKRQKSSPI